MATLDPAIAARVKAQLEANPQFQEFLRRLGTGRFNAGSISPRMFGVDSPNGYVYSLGNRQLVQNHGLADTLLPLAGGAVAGYGALSALASPAAAPTAGSGAGAIDTSIGGAVGLDLPGYIPSATPSLGGVTPAAAAAGGGGALDAIKKALMSPAGIGTAGSIAAALASGRGDGTNAQTRELQEQAARNAAITEARMRRVDPLHEAAVQLAFSRLPVSSRQGLNLTRIPLPE